MELVAANLEELLSCESLVVGRCSPRSRGGCAGLVWIWRVLILCICLLLIMVGVIKMDE